MRLSIVGCGDAAAAIALASHFVPGVRVVACVDRDRSRAERFAGRFRGSRVETEWVSLLRDETVDAVYVALPHNLHAEVATACAAARKAVLLEKPLSHDLASARHLLDSLPADHRVGVNYQYRYDPKAWALVSAARSGRLGELLYVTVDVPWHRGDDYFERSPWHGSREVAGGGTLLTQGSHALDVALQCIGSEPVAASGSTYRRRFDRHEVEDLAAAQVETAAGVPVFVVSSMVSRPGFPVSVRVFGRRGAGIYRGPARPSLRGHGVRLASPPVLSQLAAYRLSVGGFRAWVEGRERYRCPAEDAIAVLRAVHAVYESAAAGRRVEVGA